MPLGGAAARALLFNKANISIQNKQAEAGIPIQKKYIDILLVAEGSCSSASGGF